MLEWFQSFQGIMVLTFGGMSVGAIGANVFAAIRGLKNAKTTGEIVLELNKAKVFVNELLGLNKEKTNETLQKDEELVEARQVEAYLLKSMAIIIASSTGIDPLAKISLIGDLELMKKTIEEKGVAILKAQADKVITELKVDAKKIIGETLIETKGIIDKYSEK